MEFVDKVLTFLNGFNIQTILSLFAIVWYFSRDLKASIEKVDTDFKEMNTRISRVEGTVYGTKIYQSLTSEEKKKK